MLPNAFSDYMRDSVKDSVRYFYISKEMQASDHPEINMDLLHLVVNDTGHIISDSL